MFDSALCARPVTKVPLFINWAQFDWLKTFLLGVLILAFLGICLVIGHPQWRQQVIRPKAILLLISVTAVFILLLSTASQRLVMLLSADSDTSTDAIVVLGRGRELAQERVDLTVQLWHTQEASRIFTSGIRDAPRMIRLLEEKGIPKPVLDGENCSLTTAENAVFTAAILQPQGIWRIVLITDLPHMLRSLLVFRARGFTVIPQISPFPQDFGLKAKTFLTLRECAALVNYGLRGLFRAQPLQNLNNPELVTLVHQAEQYTLDKRSPH